MRELCELSINKDGKPVTRAAPIDDIIAAFGDQFCVKLPNSSVI